MVNRSFLVVSATLSIVLLGDAFAPSQVLPRYSRSNHNGFLQLDQSALQAASGGKKKRRRRKQPPGSPANPETSSISEPATSVEELASADDLDDDDEVDVAMLKDIAKFKFDGEVLGPESTENTDSESDNTALPLPDIKDTLRKKELEEEMARIEEEEAETRVKIKRSDRKAMSKLLEQDPYADADDSFFEEEEYGTVSALLGERALPFLGIPTGPLQVGHFIGALVIVLMAFVEYPGFPLTNLPTPLREAFQGGLLTVYSINVVLAVLAVFKAGERGQPAALWVAKVFTVGGLAYDQLNQLPTLEKIAEMKARKGKRALKNRKN